MRYYIFICVVSLLASSARGQVPPDTSATSLEADSVRHMPRVTVYGSRAPAMPAGAAFVERLDREAIRRSGTRDVAELLTRQAGVFVRQYGSGGLATLSMRGASASQTKVLVDGFSVADPQTGQVDLSLLPSVLLSSVDVLHGAGGARYGSAAIGGVVQLHTLRPTTVERARVTAGVGAYGTRRLGGVVTGGTGRVSALLAAETYRREGDFTYVNEALPGDPAQQRTGAGRQTGVLYGSLAYRRGQIRASASAWYGAAERGLPGAVSHPPSQAQQWNEKLNLWSTFDRRFEGGGIRLSMHAQTTRRRYRDPHAYTSLAVDDTAQTHSFTARLATDLLIARDAMLHAGLEAGIDRSAMRGGTRQRRAAGFADAHVALGLLSVYPALRLDAYQLASGTTAALAPRLGVRLQMLDAPEVALTARLARVFRMPTFAERYLEPGGNPSLEPEHGWSGEMGTQLVAGRDVWEVRVDAALFASLLDDRIAWRPSFVSAGLQVWTPGNVARVLARGVMVSLAGHRMLGRQASMKADITFSHTDARSRANPLSRAFDQQLPHVPRQRLKLHAALTWRALHLDVYGRLIGRRYVTEDESQFLSPYQVVDVRVSYRRRIGAMRFALSLGIENAFDEPYDIMRFYPMPPRHAQAHMTVEASILNPTSE